MTGLKIKPGPIHKINNHKNIPECRLIRLRTQHKSPEHIYLKFLTLLRPPVEKIMKLRGFK